MRISAVAWSAASLPFMTMDCFTAGSAHAGNGGFSPAHRFKYLFFFVILIFVMKFYSVTTDFSSFWQELVFGNMLTAILEL